MQKVLADFSANDDITIQERFRKLVPTIDEVLITSLNPYPFEISREMYRSIYDFSGLLDRALRGFLQEWKRDNSILVIDDPRAVGIVRRSLERLFETGEAESIPLGSYRPDFVLSDDDETWSICEINARFCMNAFVMAHFGRVAMEQDSRLASDHTPSLQDHLIDTILTRFRTDRPVFVLKSRESGKDILALMRFEEHSRLNFVFLDPFHEPVPSEASQFILELHQDEIVSLSDGLIEQLLGGICLNPFYSIFLLHDKRLLALLSQSWVLKYMNKEEHAHLCNHVTPSYLLREDPSMLDRVLIEKSDWVLKQATSGKGAGILFGKDLSQQEWDTMVRSRWSNEPNSWILQRYVTLRRITVVQRGHATRFRMVGTFFTVDGDFFGTSVWRVSDGDIIAVSRGGSWLLGTVAPKSPSSYRLMGLSTDQIMHISEQSQHQPETINTVHERLQDVGYAILMMDFDDPSNRFLQTLGYSLGRPDEHSSTDGVIWDVKPRPRSSVRSFTSSEFEWHTDSSFEIHPPKYLLLQVQREDTLGGGLFQIVSVEHVMSQLSKESREILLKDEFEIRRPDEFIKQGLSDLRAPLVWTGGDKHSYAASAMRYRHDIITPLTPKAKEAFLELKATLKRIKPAVEIEPRKGMILIVDNQRYLHARTRIHDKNRHLRRMRINVT